jgi:hypothetical protein
LFYFSAGVSLNELEAEDEPTKTKSVNRVTRVMDIKRDIYEHQLPGEAELNRVIGNKYTKPSERNARDEMRRRMVQLIIEKRTVTRRGEDVLDKKYGGRHIDDLSMTEKYGFGIKLYKMQVEQATWRFKREDEMTIEDRRERHYFLDRVKWMKKGKIFHPVRKAKLFTPTKIYPRHPGQVSERWEAARLLKEAHRQKYEDVVFYERGNIPKVKYRIFSKRYAEFLATNTSKKRFGELFSNFWTYMFFRDRREAFFAFGRELHPKDVYNITSYFTRSSKLGYFGRTPHHFFRKPYNLYALSKDTEGFFDEIKTNESPVFYLNILRLRNKSSKDFFFNESIQKEKQGKFFSIWINNFYANVKEIEAGGNGYKETLKGSMLLMMHQGSRLSSARAFYRRTKDAGGRIGLGYGIARSNVFKKQSEMHLRFALVHALRYQYNLSVNAFKWADLWVRYHELNEELLQSLKKEKETSMENIVKEVLSEIEREETEYFLKKIRVQEESSLALNEGFLNFLFRNYFLAFFFFIDTFYSFIGFFSITKVNFFSQRKPTAEIQEKETQFKFFYALKHARESIPVVPINILEKAAPHGIFINDQELVGADYSPFSVMHKVHQRDEYALNDNGKGWLNQRKSGRRFVKRHYFLKKIGTGRLRNGPIRGQFFVLPKDYLNPTREKGRKSFIDLFLTGGGFLDTSQKLPWFAIRNKTMETQLFFDNNPKKYFVGEDPYKVYKKEYNRKIFFDSTFGPKRRVQDIRKVLLTFDYSDQQSRDLAKKYANSRKKTRFFHKYLSLLWKPSRLDVFINSFFPKQRTGVVPTESQEKFFFLMNAFEYNKNIMEYRETRSYFRNVAFRKRILGTSPYNILKKQVKDQPFFERQKHHRTAGNSVAKWYHPVSRIKFMKKNQEDYYFGSYSPNVRKVNNKAYPLSLFSPYFIKGKEESLFFSAYGRAEASNNVRDIFLELSGGLDYFGERGLSKADRRGRVDEVLTDRQPYWVETRLDHQNPVFFGEKLINAPFKRWFGFLLLKLIYFCFSSFWNFMLFWTDFLLIRLNIVCSPFLFFFESIADVFYLCCFLFIFFFFMVCD